MVLHAFHSHHGRVLERTVVVVLPQVVVADAFGGVGVQESVFQHGHTVAGAIHPAHALVGGLSLDAAPHLEARVVLFAGGQPGQAHMVPVLPFAGKAQQFHRQGKALGGDVELAETGHGGVVPAHLRRRTDLGIHPGGGGEVHEVVAHGGVVGQQTVLVGSIVLAHTCVRSDGHCRVGGCQCGELVGMVEQAHVHPGTGDRVLRFDAPVAVHVVLPDAALPHGSGVDVDLRIDGAQRVAVLLDARDHLAVAVDPDRTPAAVAHGGIGVHAHVELFVPELRRELVTADVRGRRIARVAIDVGGDAGEGCGGRVDVHAVGVQVGERIEEQGVRDQGVGIGTRSCGKRGDRGVWSTVPTDHGSWDPGALEAVPVTRCPGQRGVHSHLVERGEDVVPEHHVRTGTGGQQGIASRRGHTHAVEHEVGA